jgi:hypothetical protein
MDNTSNNDTLMAALEVRYQAEGIKFSARESRMWCMPHTIHLASLKVRNYLLPPLCHTLIYLPAS